MEAFLTREERRLVQRTYEKWNKYVQGDELMNHFYCEGILSDRDRADYIVKQTSFERNEFLFDQLLMRATYEQICQVRKFLLSSEFGAHQELAYMFPVRQDRQPHEPSQWPNAHPQQATTGGQNNGGGGPKVQQPDIGGQPQGGMAGNQQPGGGDEPMDQDEVRDPPADRERRPYRHRTQDLHTPTERPRVNGNNSQQQTSQQGTNTQAPHSNNNRAPPGSNQAPPTGSNQAPPTGSDLVPPTGSNPAPTDAPDHVPFTASRYNLETKAYKQHVKVTPNGNNNPDGVPHGFVRNPVPVPETIDVPMDDVPNAGFKLGRYGVKTNSQSGNGLCLILANFTKDLTGYENDIKEITDFFQNKLKYKVLGAPGSQKENEYRNLTTEDFFMKLQETRDQLVDAHAKIDRLFVFVMSHGDEFGIKMTPPDKQDNSVRDRIKTDKMVEMFNHNHVPTLKGLPKCFFVQVCRGVEIAKAANRSAATPETSTMADNQHFERPQVVALGADTLVCHAAKEGNYSWVVDSGMTKGGSWFLQATMEVFNKYYQNEHVLDMMSEVNNRVSYKQGKAKVVLHGHTSASIVTAYQLPAVCNNLTKKLYL